MCVKNILLIFAKTITAPFSVGTWLSGCMRVEAKLNYCTPYSDCHAALLIDQIARANMSKLPIP